MKEPSSLTETSIRCLTNNLLSIVDEHAISLKELACFSPRLGDLLMKVFIDEKRKTSSTTDHFLSLFQKFDPQNLTSPQVLIQITQIDFRSCAFITDHSISRYLRSHDLIETIDLRDCNVTYKIFDLLTKNFPRLKNLSLGRTEDKPQTNKSLKDFFPRDLIETRYVLKKPRLKYFVIEGVVTSEENSLIGEIFRNSLIQSSQSIRHLDLSRNTFLNSLQYLTCFKGINSLILYDVQPRIIESAIEAICEMKNITLLDLSYNRRLQEASSYLRPTLTLAKLAYSLPKLVSLDLSGTNLDGSYPFDSEEEITFYKKNLQIDPNENFTMDSSISGLLLLQNKLDFLGLFDTEDHASSRPTLPAINVAGEHNELMLTNALVHYVERPTMLTHIMAHLFRLYNHYTIQHPLEAGQLVMNSMEKHVFDRGLQTSGSACLYYVVDMFQNEPQDVLNKYQEYLKRLLFAILTAMNTHINHSPMIRNGLLTISRMQMHLPNQIMCGFEKTVDVLLKFIRLFLNEHIAHEQILLHNALSVLNHIACSVDGQEKLYIGKSGAIETSMGIIRLFLTKNISDDIAETAWTLLWNITDETPENCRRFVEDNQGLKAFLECLEARPEKRDLIRNMLGLLGNVAEVRELRPYLVTPELMENFRHLLKRPQQNDIEIPYNCAGILANILSDGIATWSIGSYLDQNVINQDMFEAVQTWDLRKSRTINYRSLAPILRLLDDSFPTGCVTWAVWAMTNLTTVLPSKYCVLARNEHGEPLLKRIIDNEKFGDAIRNLAATAIENIEKFYNSDAAMEIETNEEAD